MAGRRPIQQNGHDGAPAAPSLVRLARSAERIGWERYFFMSVGVLLFCAVYFYPSFSDAVGPKGERFLLTDQARGALALFLLAATWLIFEVVPIGVTSITIGVVQVLFQIRPARAAFGDFMDPSVWFIIGSITFGMVFSKTGLTKRMAYGMLALVGERTSMIYLGSFIITLLLTLIMAHTTVAATIFPLLMAICGLYSEDDKPTQFGKGLFIGMAYVAGAGSIITLLGSARAAVAIGFFKEMAGREVSFLELPYYMLPIGCVMVALIWLLCMILFKPEKRTIPGLKERARMLYQRLGPVSRIEILSMVIILSAIAMMGARSFLPILEPLDKTAIILAAAILFFVLNILSLKDLEGIPWNIVLLFGGSMSMGFCLWETGATQWLAIKCLAFFQAAPWFLFVMGVAFFILATTNLIINVAVIALLLPVALVMAPYLGVAPEVIFFSCLVTAGMPFMLLVGAAPNAIAYESKQFSSRQFFLAGVPASMMAMAVLAFFVWLVWPLMGMPVVVQLTQ